MTNTGSFLSTALLAVLLSAGQASAHSALRSSTPADGAAVAAVDSIGMTFSDSVNLRFSKVAVTLSTGEAVQTGKPEVSGDGYTLSIPLPAPLESGSYTVNWNALSKDGHKVEGKFGFTVD